MRALLDANIYISYLLSPQGHTPPIAVVEAAFAGAYTLLITAAVISEIRDKTTTKAFLADRIAQRQTDRLVGVLQVVAETVLEIGEPLPEVGRDRKDDYLYAHALVGRVDYLVSGDKDVRAIKRIGNMQIFSPAEFLQVLQRTGRV